MRRLTEMTGQLEKMSDQSAAQVLLQERMKPSERTEEKKPGPGSFADSGQEIQYTVIAAGDQKNSAAFPEQENRHIEMGFGRHWH